MKKFFNVKNLKFIFLFCCISCILFGGCNIVKSQTNIENYDSERNKYGYACNFMPEFDELGYYKDIMYRRKSTSMIMFDADAMTLFVDYDEDNYIKQKQIITETYNFLEEPIFNDQGSYIIPVTQFELKGYNFKISPEGSTDSACKSFGLIGFNDIEYKLCYAYFYDLDLDYICEQEDDPEEKMIDFMQRYFYWE